MTDTSLIQQRLNVAPTDVWDMPTESALVQWQAQRGFKATGNPDPITLAAMAIYDPVAGAPSSFQQSLATGEEPGHFWRDVGTATSQIPRWAWLSLGTAFGALAVFAWMSRGRGQG